MTEQQQRNKLLIGNAETLRALSNPMATGEESASSGTRPCGSNPLYERVVLNPTGRMTLVDTSKDPDGRPTLSEVSGRSQMKIATWNVRTLNTLGKTELLEGELQKYNININVMGLAETKWKGDEGHDYTEEGNMFIHAKTDKKECGVGFLVDRISSKAVMGYESCLLYTSPSPRDS